MTCYKFPLLLSLFLLLQTVTAQTDGEVITYFDGTSTIKTKANYANNHLHGTYEAFDETGRSIAKGQYENGKKVGLWELYNEKRKRRKTYTQFYLAGDPVGNTSRRNRAVLIVSQNNRFGAYNDGELKIPIEYNQLTFLTRNLLLARKDNRMGVLTGSGATITPFAYEQLICDDFQRKLIGVKNGKYGYLDYDGNVLIPFEYDTLQSSQDGPMKAVKNGKIGYINPDNSIAVPFEYDYGTAYMNGVAFVKKGDQSFTINKEGGLVEGWDGNNWMMYSSSNQFDTTNVSQFGKPLKANTGETFTLQVQQQDKLYGVLLQNGAWLIAPKFDQILHYKGNLIVVQQNNRYGVYNDHGEEVIPLILTAPPVFYP